MASHNSDDDLARAQRDSTGSDRVPLTKRGFLGGSATAVTGSAAGCLDRNGEPTTPGQQTTPGSDGETLTVDRLTTAQHNDVVHAGEYDTLNAAIDDAPDGPVHVVLPSGVTEFDEPIADLDRDLYVEGAGMDQATVRSAGPGVFYSQHGDRPDRTVQLEGFTLDLDHNPSDEVIVVDGDFGRLLVDDFRGKNVNLEETGDQRGFFEFRTGTVDLVQIDDSELRFDTITNRDRGQFDEAAKYLLFNGSAGGGPAADKEGQATIERLVVRNTRNVGERIHLGDRPEVNHYIAYRAFIGRFALVSGCEFHHWDQYATFLQGGSDATIKVHNNLILHPGDADMIRTGATEDGTIIHIHGNVVRHAYMPGDRGIINQNTSNATPAAVKITDNVVEDFHVGCEVTGGRNITIADNTFADIGHATDPDDFSFDPRFGDDVGSHVAIMVRSRNTTAQNVRIADNTITNTTDERKMGPGIWVWESQDWEPGFLVVENNIIVGNDNRRGGGSDQAMTLDVDTPAVVQRNNEVMDESYQVLD